MVSTASFDFLLKEFLFIQKFPVGGAVLEDGDGTDLAQVYNPKTCVWTELASMQIARSGSAACTLKGKLYVIGVYIGGTLDHNAQMQQSQIQKQTR